MLTQVQDNPAMTALAESRDEVKALNEFLCHEGLWSEQQAERVIAETRPSKASTRSHPR